MISETCFKEWQQWARQDNALQMFVPSDIRQMLGEIERLRSAGQLAHSALDAMMGDSDLPDDDSLPMKAMQALSAVLPEPA